MSFFHLHSSYSVKHLVDNLDCGSVGRGTIVDVSGSHGQVSIAIAENFLTLPVLCRILTAQYQDFAFLIRSVTVSTACRMIL